MKKILLSILLIPLLFVELIICTGFLPLEWQHAVYERIPKIFPDSPHDWSRVTHPRMELEMDEVFRQNLWLRVASYVFVGLLLVANTMLLRFVWNGLRGTKSINANRS